MSAVQRINCGEQSAYLAHSCAAPCSGQTSYWHIWLDIRIMFSNYSTAQVAAELVSSWGIVLHKT